MEFGDPSFGGEDLQALDFEFGDLWQPGQRVSVMRAEKRKREWEDETVDDVLTLNGSLRGPPSSGGSYSTRRRKTNRRNQEANARSAARLRHRPEFKHIAVVDGGVFKRHFKPGLQFAQADPIITEYMESKQQFELLKQMGNKCMMTPCDEAQMRHLQFFDRPPLRASRPQSAELDRALQFVRKILTVPGGLEFPHAENLEGVRYKARKYPGNEYHQMGFTTRGEAQEAALVDAKLAWSQLMAGERVEPHQVRLGGRGKLVNKSQKDAEEDGTPKGRLILMLSQRDLLLLGNVEQILTEAYKDEQYPMSIGFGWFGGNVTRTVERLGRLSKYFCMDAEKFDASLDPWLVQEALRILRAQFAPGWTDGGTAYWAFVEETLLEAPICRDDGWVMLRQVGTTSGHSFNTLVQSVCSLILGYTGLLCNTAREKWGLVLEESEIETLGDDNETGVGPTLEAMTGLQYGRPVRDLTGVNWLGDKSFATDTLLDLEPFPEDGTEDGRFQGVQYLGKYLRLIDIPAELGGGEAVVPYRPMEETVARVLYPEREARDVLHLYERVLGNLLDGYGNPLTARWLNELLDWLEPKLAFMPTTWTSDSVQDAARDYTAVEVEVPKPKRWSWEEWLVLTLSEKRDAQDMYIVC
uniref:RNA-dependent RNA polymerase n=1 Tax=Gremmeniella abietina RNA virus 6 TaxID=1565456 RepID=A0A0A0R9Q5_9VIRU|nr:RNA-dependent RNA polymerase [Gremmeniella abietina RNA virus 6]